MSQHNALKNGELFPRWLHMPREDFERWARTLKVVKVREHLLRGDDYYSWRKERER